MLQTINGIDLMLVFIIAGLYINVYKLNRECESYVDQLIDLSRDNYELSKLQLPKLDDDYLDSLLEKCPHIWIEMKDNNALCAGCNAKRTDLSCEFTSKCVCKDCVPF
jgi:hypothetical protein